MPQTTKKLGCEPGRVGVYWMNLGWYSDRTFETLVEAVTYAREKGFSAIFTRGGQHLGSWDAIGGLRIERTYYAEYYGHAKAQAGSNWGGAR